MHTTSRLAGRFPSKYLLRQFSSSRMNIFSGAFQAPADPILSVEANYKADRNPLKVNLGVGAYRTEEGLPHVFTVVREVQRKMAFDPALNKEYNPIDGKPELKELTQKMIFGDCKALKENRVASAQTLSGTGALKVAGDVIHRICPNTETVYVSKPTWGNHHQIFPMAGLKVAEYPYWNPAARDLDFEALLGGLKQIPSKQAVLLHSVAHNPTGVDPTQAQWRQIRDVIVERELLPIMDTAYQGFASGDLETDAWAIRLFEEAGIQMVVCQSFAKNMGLYGERIGMLHIVCSDAEQASMILSQIKTACRANYSTPPIHGGNLVHEILSNPVNYSSWTMEMKALADRIKTMRVLLRTGLEKLGTPGDWSHITKQIGMFSFTGLSVEQSKAMTSKHHVYMVSNGRISLAGLNKKNVEYVAAAIDDVVRNVK